MVTAIIGIGLPGSGKTTFFKRLADQDTVRICPDDIRQQLTGNAADQTRNAEVWRQAYDDIAVALTSGHNVIVDATNARQFDRLQLVTHCRTLAERVEGVWFVTPTHLCRWRNRHRSRVVPGEVMNRMITQLREHPPTRDEGFDELTHVDMTRKPSAAK